MAWLAGKKTYILSILALGIGAAKAFGVDIPGFEGTDPGLISAGGLIAAALRNGMK